MKTLFLIALTILMSWASFAQVNHDFSPNRKIVSCGPNNVYFVYNKAVIPDLIKWDFGDGGTSTQINPVHYYSNTGVYTVKLYVTKNNICDTVIKQNFITILNKPEASFDVIKVPTDPLSLEFKSTSLHHSNSFAYQHWIMGFDTICKTPNMNLRFNKNGKYTISLKVANNEGCTDIKDTTVEVDFPELDPVGVKEDVTQNHLIYPNPTNGILNLNIAAGCKINKLTLVDNNYKQIDVQPAFNGNLWTADLSELKQGIYQLWIETDKETYKARVIIAP